MTKPFKTTAAAQPGTGAAPASAAAEGNVQRIRSEQLFAGSREVQIDHLGAIYRLKQTALGKLILTK